MFQTAAWHAQRWRDWDHHAVPAHAAQSFVSYDIGGAWAGVVWFAESSPAVELLGWGIEPDQVLLNEAGAEVARWLEHRRVERRDASFPPPELTSVEHPFQADLIDKAAAGSWPRSRWVPQ